MAIESTMPDPYATNDFDYFLSIPLTGEQQVNDVDLDDLLDFDFSFDDDLYLPSNDGNSFDPTQYPTRTESFTPTNDQTVNAFKTSSLELPHGELPDNSRITPNCNNDAVAGYLNVFSHESDGSNDRSGEVRVLNCLSPAESQGSGSHNLSEAKSVTSSPNLDVNSIKNGVVSERINLDNNTSKDSCLLKRKKGSEANIESRTNKYQKSISEHSNISTEEEKKKNVRLVRNRESAQLSRQRKKHYVEELEDKVRLMHSTIQDLNSKVSYIMSENMGLRQQLGTGMYPPMPMMYPYMTPPPYMVNPNGSHVPLLPIPRLQPKPKQSVPKKSNKTKKVASISFLGLLFFILLFGGLVPMMNMRNGRSDSVLNKKDHKNGRVVFTNESKHGNESEPLMASLYVPRNDKLVKIDGNLIIHSILASEKARDETSLALPVPVPSVGHNNHRLHQWFREGLAGPMLSSGMCKEVFQFEVSKGLIPRNVTGEKNSTNINKGRNRRILHGVPMALPGSSGINVTEEGRKGNIIGGGSSMVVSVLMDPREAGVESEVEGMMGSKSLSRIFVVVLIDSVKYVTYSCMLPFKGASTPHHVTI